MPSATQKVTDKAITVLQQGDAVVRPSRIPRFLRFPLIVVISTVLSSFLYSFTADYTAADLAAVSRRLENWWEIGILVSFRTQVFPMFNSCSACLLACLLTRPDSFELGLGWFGNYDGYDLASLTLLSHGPPVSYSSCAGKHCLTF